jgi:hypothetical protein
MAPLDWSKSAHVKIPPDVVFAWMTNFQEDDHGRTAFVKGTGASKKYTKKPSKRTVLSSEGNHVHILDEWGGRKFDMQLELVPLDRTVKVQGPMGYFAIWKAVPDNGGTKVEAQISLHMKGLRGLLAPLFRKRFYRDLEYDFNGHISDLQDTEGA